MLELTHPERHPSKLIQAVLDSPQKRDLRDFLIQLQRHEQRYLLRNDILAAFDAYCALSEQPQLDRASPLAELVYYTQEIIKESESLYWVIRPQIGCQETFRLTSDLLIEPIGISELLNLRDRFVNRYSPEEGGLLEIDFQPFYDYSPTIRDPKNVGKGMQLLTRYLASKLFQNPEEWLQVLFQFLSLHSYDGQQLLINQRLDSHRQLSQRLKQALLLVNRLPYSTPFADFRFELQNLGFEPGWGNTAARVRETLELLDGLLDSPDAQALENFLSRIPMIFRVVLVSPHGWFGQEGVLGRPDTGGQVVYVLDQARSLEQQLIKDMELAGLTGLPGFQLRPKVLILTRLIPESDGTRCNEPLEKVYGTENVWILRVPLRTFNPKVTSQWISRFEIWPYLETFAIDAEKALLAEFAGRPDLVIGNYSDGNLVAFLLARRLGVTQGIIAHALEKSKYLFSNLYWQDLEEKYHFSLQFTVDLLVMNAANFVITSTYQEIVGTPDSVGQYESYRSFTMPELYHVVSGIELGSPKFNLVPPGVNESYFFPYSKTEERLTTERQRLEELLFTLVDPNQVFGELTDPNKRPLFSMARLDRIKNLTGLAEIFGQSNELQAHCNLILIAGKLRTADTTDHEEAAEIEKLYEIIDRYQLQGKIRWLGVRLSKTDSGEIYRIIADHQGIFVQPALFEAFGLTILEAMITGLPTFATEFGGPREIIQDGFNGYLINPTRQEVTAARLLEFVQQCEQQPQLWGEVSQRAIERVYSSYTWQIHTTRLLSLARTYGFWNYTQRESREDLLRYIESLFYLLFKPRAQELLRSHLQR